MKRIQDIKSIPKGIRVKAGYKQRSRSFPQSDGALELIQRANECYDAHYKLRQNIRRAMRYYRGDQWSDTVVVNGKVMTEAEYIQMQGKPALKQNLIRPPVRNILGQFRRAPYKSLVIARNRDDQKAAEMISVALESAYEMNKGKEKDARQLEVFLTSGTAIYNTGFRWSNKRMRAIPTFEPIPFDMFFQTPDAKDICGEDVDLIGHISDLSIEQVLQDYAKTKEEQRELEEIFAASTRRDYSTEQVKSREKPRNDSFLYPNDPTKCRVFKICRLEGNWKVYAHDPLDSTYQIYDMEDKPMIEAENAARRLRSQMDNRLYPEIKPEDIYVREWVYYHLTASGHCLFKASNPYKHKDHPYVVKLYPMIGDQVWSLVDDIIDQNRMVNRMTILQDFIISASSKGVLLVPEDCVTDDFTLEDIAEEWTKYNGVIKIKTKPGVQLPQQVVARNMPVGINDMINLQMKLINDIGGVHEAMQGKTAASGTPAGLYQMETSNAQLNIVDYLESYSSFLQDRDYKMLQIIQQYYTEPQYIALAGKAYSEEAKHYDPEAIKDIQFENTISRTTDTATMRMYMDDMLKFLLERQLIGVEMFLEHSSFPFADKLLQTIARQKEQLEQGQMPDNMDMAQLGQQAGQSIPESSAQGMHNAQQLYNMFLRGGQNASA